VGIEPRRHPFGLVLGIAAGEHSDRVALAVLGPQALVEELVVVRDERIGGGEDAAAGAVVLLQLDDAQPGVVLREQAQVLDGRRRASRRCSGRRRPRR